MAKLTRLFPIDKRRLSAIKQNLCERRMPVQRWSDADLHILMCLGQLFHDGWQVALQVDSEGQEVRDHQDSGHPGIGQASHSLGQIGSSFQKRGFDSFKRSRGCRRLRHNSDGFVGGWHTGSVRKDDNSRIHRYYEHSNMLKRLMVALVGMAMGGLAGLVVALMGAGNLAIVLGAAVGGLVFSIAAPRVGRAA